MEHIVVISGSGISAESGLDTFRDADGIWARYDMREVATPEGWRKDPAKVLEFYNLRRREVVRAQPNPAHLALAELQQHFRVSVITQNVDDLHERAGSSEIIHLHGEILKARSTGDPGLIYDTGGEDITLSQTCDAGFPLRPHIVWFGEAVPLMERAESVVRTADHILVVGTSLQVYPAALLVEEQLGRIPCTVVDPELQLSVSGVRCINANATEGVPRVIHEWINRGTTV